MNEPWIAPEYMWIPGTALGVLAGLWGSLVGVFGSRGKAKVPVYVGFWSLFGCGVISLALGITAFVAKQPYGVWYGFSLAGFIVVLVVGINGFTMRNVYRMAEQRKIAAEDL